MSVDRIVTLLRELLETLSSFEEGDVMALASIRELMKGLLEEFDSNDELKKLKPTLHSLVGMVELASLVPDKEKEIVQVLLEINKLFDAFFSKKMRGKEFLEALHTYLPKIKEYLSYKNQKLSEQELEEKDQEKTKELYSEDYFANVMDDNSLLAQFYNEAVDHLDEAQYSLLDLEHDTDNQEIINKVFRAFHTIKGSGAFLGLKNIEEVSHKMEDLMSHVRDGKLLLSRELIDVVFYGMELIRTLLNVMQVNNFNAEGIVSSFRVVNIFPYVGLLQKILDEYEVKKIGEILQERGTISLEQLKAMLEQQGETHEKLGQIAIEENVASPEAVANALKEQQRQQLKARKFGYVKVSNERLNSLVDLVGELVINQSMLRQELQNANIQLSASDRSLVELEKITTLIKNIVLSMGMLPISEIFNKLRVVSRNTAEALNKTVTVESEGDETELDRNVMETIYDPLVHIIRNAVDHGIESPEKRTAAGKNKVGKIQLKAAHKGNGIEIVVEDDGEGIDRARVIQKAIEKKLITKDEVETLSEKQIYELMFLPGFSTNDEVTHLSGRGVGLDVVKKNLDKIHGRVEVESKPHLYTKFVIKLPLTLAIIEGFVTKVGENKYVFPFNMIDEVLVLNKKQIIASHDENEAIIYYREKHIPVIYAHRIFGEALNTEKDNFMSLIMTFGNFEYCIVVDKMLGKQEIVIRNLSGLSTDYRYFSGGTVFGDGTIGFVVDIQGLIESAKKET